MQPGWGHWLSAFTFLSGLCGFKHIEGHHKSEKVDLNLSQSGDIYEDSRE